MTAASYIPGDWLCLVVPGMAVVLGPDTPPSLPCRSGTAPWLGRTKWPTLPRTWPTNG